MNGTRGFQGTESSQIIDTGSVCLLKDMSSQCMTEWTELPSRLRLPLTCRPWSSRWHDVEPIMPILKNALAPCRMGLDASYFCRRNTGLHTGEEALELHSILRKPLPAKGYHVLLPPFIIVATTLGQAYALRGVPCS